MKNQNDNKRFVCVHDDTMRGFLFNYGVRIFADLMTGIQYVYFASGSGGGVSVLLGTDGKPLLYQPPNV